MLKKLEMRPSIGAPGNNMAPANKRECLMLSGTQLSPYGATDGCQGQIARDWHTRSGWGETSAAKHGLGIRLGRGLGARQACDDNILDR